MKRFIILALLAISSCFGPSNIIEVGSSKTKLRKINLTEVLNLEDVHKFDLTGIKNSYLNSCKTIQSSQKQYYYTNLIKLASRTQLLEHCKNISKLTNDAAFMKYVLQNFDTYEIISKSNQSKFTGYYVAGLQGNLTQTEKYKYPIYGLPKHNYLDITRHDIDVKNSLHGKNLELLWVSSYHDVYTLHLQGSGVVQLEDGNVVKLVFAGKNSYKYYSVETYYNQNLRKHNGNMNFETWSLQNPEEAMKIYTKNRSYVFFKIDKTNGTQGSTGTSLTTKRSIAIDTDYIPYHSLMWIQTKNNQFNGPVVAQDTGGAIKGSVRADIFFGASDSARHQALALNSPGRSFIFIPRR